MSARKRRKRNNYTVTVHDDADEQEERFFLNPESVSEHLYCSICQEVFLDPQRAPCGHSFCKKCIYPWLMKNRTCPEDRKSLKPEQLHRDFILENIIGDQQVACPFRSSGCSHVGQLEFLKVHKKSCSFNPSNLPDFLLMTSPSTASTHEQLNSSDDEGGPVPKLGRPSLKMRLFNANAEKRQLLCSMFETQKQNP